MTALRLPSLLRYLMILGTALSVAACGGRKPETDDNDSNRATETSAEVNPTDTIPIRQVAPVDSALTIEVHISPKIPPYLFKIRPDWQKKLFTEIEVDQEGKEVQRLTGFDMEEGTIAETDDPASFFTLKDLNFDNYLDIQLVRNGSTHARAYNYWIFDPKAKQFVSDKVIRDEQGSAWLNEKDKAIMFHTNQGCGGRCYTNNTYQYNDSTHAFILIRTEVQASASGKKLPKEKKEKKGKEKERQRDDGSASGKFIRTITERKGGKMVLISRKILNDSEAN